LLNEKNMSFNITANSVPVYDSWGWSDYWACEDWVTWFNAVKTRDGEATARQKFIDAWIDGLSTISGGRGKAPGSNYFVDSVPIDCRTFNANFRSFLDLYPDVKSAVFSGLGGTIGKVESTTVGTAETVVDAAGNIVKNAADSASTASTVLKYAIPVVIISALIGGLIYIGNTVVNDKK
jgi:hypothetical protein